MHFLRVIRLDDSDARVYDPPAQAGEWAVGGAFAFIDADLETLTGKAREAFRHGFLGTESFGWATLVQVEEIDDAEYRSVIERLARHFVERYGAPDLDSARQVAREEAEFAASLCAHPPHTLLAVERDTGADGIVESFRVVPPPDGLDHSRMRLWGPVDE